jgi:micrococcal nuclease
VNTSGVLRTAVVALVALTTGCRSETAPTEEDRFGGELAVVERVVDGDGLRLADGRQVRLLQIDAPELKDDCYGRDALRELLALAPQGTRVALVGDPALDDRDDYGRLLRYVLVDGRNLNIELVARGAASPYYFRGDRGRHAAALDDAAEAARAAGRGYWGACPLARLEPGRGSVTGPASSRRR